MAALTRVRATLGDETFNAAANAVLEAHKLTGLAQLAVIGGQNSALFQQIAAEMRAAVGA